MLQQPIRKPTDMQEKMYVCSRCQGTKQIERDSKLTSCYHCVGEGYLPLEIAKQDRYIALSEKVGIQVVREEMKNPEFGKREDCSDFFLHIADYTSIRTLEMSGLSLDALLLLPEPVLNALCTLVGIKEVEEWSGELNQPKFTFIGYEDTPKYKD